MTGCVLWYPIWPALSSLIPSPSFMNSPFKCLLRFSLFLVGFGLIQVRAAGPVVTDYTSIQEAIDKNPGKMIEVPAGDFPISAGLVIRADNTGLFGPGRIIQNDIKKPILVIQNAANVQVRDLTLTRPDGRTDCETHGISVDNCTNLVLQNVRVLNNCSQPPVIKVETSKNVRILNCAVENYMRLGVDDRTAGTDYAFAFNVIDGTGIAIRSSTGVLIQGTSVIENKMLPTPELKEKYNLGKFSKKNAVRGTITSQKMWDEEYYNAWHQGSAIVIASPENDDYIQLLGNYIENAAQGLDVHADHVIVSQNIFKNAFIGMKAMHGSRNVIITNNQFSRNDLWAIGLMSGAASHAAGVDANPTDNVKESPANVDGGSIIANNIISDFGYGTAHWMWPEARAPILLTKGQKDINPPLTDVIIQGNIVYDTGRDKILVDGRPVLDPPRYQWAVFVSPPQDPGPPSPVGLHFSNNIFHPGTKGVSNIELTP